VPVHLGQVRLGGELSYALESVTPYVSAMYEIDYRNSEGGDRTGAVLGVGLRTAVTENFTAGAFASAQVLRDDDENVTFGVNLRYSF
jgi:outer membrane autotransporter protein